MTTKEKAAYIKGLLSGMDLDQDKKETKIFTAISDILEDLALDLEETKLDIEEIQEGLDVIDSDLCEIEEEVFGECDEYCCGEDCDCDSNDCTCGEDCSCDGDCCRSNDAMEDEFYEVFCPNCNEQVCFTENILANESIKCPNCNELLEFDCECDCCNDKQHMECDDECKCGSRDGDF